MDSRLFWLTSVALLGVLGWMYFAQTDTTSRKESAAPTEFSAPAPAPAEPADAPGRKDEAATGFVTVSTPQYVAVFDEKGGRLSSFKLNEYNKRKVNPDLPDEKIELINQPNPDDWPMRLSLSDQSGPRLERAPFLANAREVTVEPGQSAELAMTYTDPSGLKVTRLFTFNADSYLIGQEVTLDNSAGGVPLDGYVTIRLNSAPFRSKASSYYEEMGAYINNSLVAKSAKDAPKALGKYQGNLYSLDWIGYMDQYFLTALVAHDQGDGPTELPAALSAAYQDHGGVAVSVSNALNLPQGKKAVYYYDFYYGPKSSGDLTAAGHNLAKSIDLGWFSFLARPLAAILKWIYSWCGNYGVAIIVVTILIKILLWPLTAKSYRSMKSMQKLQPKVMKLREKYADDKEAMNREIMHLYKTFKINPLGGCLPMLLQIPFFIAFYRMLDSLLELRGAPFILWIQDLAAPDRLGAAGFTIPFFEPPTGVPVLTLLMGASMVLQQKMTPNTMGDPIQAKMMMLMPVVFTFILINMPAGLVLYWLVNNVLSIAQQKIINRPEKPAAAALVKK